MAKTKRYLLSDMISNGNDKDSINDALPEKSRKTYTRDRLKPPPDRLVRFALQAADDANLDELKKKIDICLATRAQQYIPELIQIADTFWDYHRKVGKHPQHSRRTRRPDDFLKSAGRDPAKPQPAPVPYYLDDAQVKARKAAADNNQPPGIPFKLAAFNPRRKKQPPKHFPKLADYNFLILTLPIYEHTYKRSRCNAGGDLYDIAYLLKQCGELMSVSPDIQYPHFQPLSFIGGGTCPENVDEDWHLVNINFDAVPPGLDGAGIPIGHPDTGWTPHSELNFQDGGAGGPASANIDENADINILDPNSASAEERVPSPPGFLRWRYHGTRTAGMLVSDASSGGELDDTDDEELDRVRGGGPRCHSGFRTLCGRRHPYRRHRSGGSDFSCRGCRCGSDFHQPRGLHVAHFAICGAMGRGPRCDRGGGGRQ